MTIDHASHDFLPSQISVELQRGVTRDEWLSAGSGGLERALVKSLGGERASTSTVKQLLALYVSSSDKLFGSEWGARRNMAAELRELFLAGRAEQCDRTIVLVLKKENPEPR